MGKRSVGVSEASSLKKEVCHTRLNVSVGSTSCMHVLPERAGWVEALDYEG